MGYPLPFIVYPHIKGHRPVLELRLGLLEDLWSPARPEPWLGRGLAEPGGSIATISRKICTRYVLLSTRYM